MRSPSRTRGLLVPEAWPAFRADGGYMGVGAASALTIQATGDVPVESNLRAVPIACESL